MLFSTTVNKSLLRLCVHFTFGIANDPLSPTLSSPCVIANNDDNDNNNAKNNLIVDCKSCFHCNEC
jgi:hypothetical protein